MRLLNIARQMARLDHGALYALAIAMACALSGSLHAQDKSPSGAAALPTWPQQFTVAGPESAGFGFMVTQPGLVSVDIAASGVPILAVLSGPGAQPTQQSGTGALHLTHEVTPQEVQQGMLWSIRISVANGSAPGSSMGTVTVREPPVDTARALSAVQSVGQRGAQREQSLLQARNSPATEQARAQFVAGAAARQARFEQQRQQVIAQEFEKLRPLAQQAQARLGASVQSRAVMRADAATTGSMANRNPELLKSPRPAIVVPPATATSSQALEAAGTSTPQQVVLTPAIASVSITQGDPGKPLLINGSGFANGGGEVHFIVSPGMDLSARVDVWSDTQIFTSVPAATGIQAFDGQMYVVRAGDKARSALIPFHFNPQLVRREILSTGDRWIASPYYDTAGPDEVKHANGNPFGGFKGDDQLFGNTHLRNGWQASDAIVACRYSSNPNWCEGGAYLSEMRPGTDSPYIKVHWWLPPGSFLGNYAHTYYHFAVGIVGPHGVPDGVVCTSAPCKDP